MLDRIKQVWKDLSRNIYVGERLEKNLYGITLVSVFSALLGLVMVIINLIRGGGFVVVTSLMFFVGGLISAFAAGAYKARKVSAAIALTVCIFTFTYYAIDGSMDGFSIVWALIMPIGVSYFLSVKYGILISAYYELLCIILFYTPIRTLMRAHYTEVVMTRYPIVFLALSGFTIVAMVQYHRLVLRDNEFADRMKAEVKRQTAVAMERLEKLEQMSEETVNTLAVAIDAKDRYTNGHSFRVAAYSTALARRLGLEEEEVMALRREAMLHDIGKIGVSDLVLNKPGKLTPEEFEIIKSHTATGGKILHASDSLSGAADVAIYHHERYDGTGYPTGKSKEDIPLHARIVAIADAYDAMRSDRIYRKGLPPEVIRKELTDGKGTQFDPEMLDVFVGMADDGELDVVTEKANKILLRAIEYSIIEQEEVTASNEA